MQKQIRSAFIHYLILAALLAGALVSRPALTPTRAEAEAPAGANAAYATTITVNSSLDPNTSNSEICLNYPTACTLRRAVNQANGVASTLRPALIQFNIPTSDPGYNASLKIWKIQFAGTSTTSNAALRRLTGSITIDGSTQPGGRSSGPKIILVGHSSTGSADGLILGETANEGGNVIRHLGFQNFNTHLQVNSSGNLIEYNWFGLSNDGLQPALRAADATRGSGGIGVWVYAGSGNTISHNVFLGLDDFSAKIDGSSNTFSSNYIGTRYDGRLTGKQSDPALVCSGSDWLGGGGLELGGTLASGINHLVQGNYFAGLRQQGSSGPIWPTAIYALGSRHRIAGNHIGVDYAGTDTGVCGRGIYINGAQFTEVNSNTIAETGLSAILLGGSTHNAVTLRGNIIRRTAAWPVSEGAIQFEATLPDAFESFQPAVVTRINGDTVTGRAGSPCAGCQIELFLDDADGTLEALQSTSLVTANPDGTWTAILKIPLSEGQGLRTTSTGALGGLSAGTTTGLSTIYFVESKVFLPLLRR